jgi:DNA-binding response OmpR family regulator
MSAKILIIDDEPDIVLFLMDQLTVDGFEVASASDGLSGLEKARQFLPDIIISDNLMPNKSGLQVVDSLRQDPKLEKTPVILITAKYQMRELFDVFSRIVVVKKPFQYSELLVHIRTMLSKFTNKAPTRLKKVNLEDLPPPPAKDENIAPAGPRRKILMAGSDRELLPKLKQGLAEKGYIVNLEFGEDTTINAAKSFVPDFVMIQNSRDPGQFDTDKLLEDLSILPETKSISLIVFSQGTATEWSDLKMVRNNFFIRFADAADLQSKIMEVLDKCAASDL